MASGYLSGTWKPSVGDEFNVTLPSNSSSSYYPDNTNGNFYTRLDRPLKLARGDWVVGISDIHFTKSWHNVVAGSVTWLEEHIADPASIEPDDRAASNSPDYILKPGEALFLRKRLVLNPGLYGSVEDVLTALKKLFVRTLLEDAVRFFYRKNVDRVYMSFFSEDGRLRQLSFSDDLCEILGFPKATPINHPGYYATRSPDIDRGMTGLYVYSDVVDNRLVGDAFVPLLRVVPLNSKLADKYENVYIEFNNIQYHDIASIHGRDIEIRIARDNGETVVFDKGKVIVNLHFKRIYRA
jgi:hypothetical protein